MTGFVEEKKMWLYGRLLSDMLDDWDEINQEKYNPKTGTYELPRFPDDCVKIVDRLKAHSTVPEIETLKPNADDRDFEALARSVKEYIKRNEPETGIDRLHTFVYKYIRNLCVNYGISIEKSKPLHSAFGEYIKSLRSEGIIETEMTARILKTNISILEAFNKVRNEHSQAHDNEILGYQEALLIFNNVISMIRFLESIEVKAKKANVAEVDIPF